LLGAATINEENESRHELVHMMSNILIVLVAVDAFIHPPPPESRGEDVLLRTCSLFAHDAMLRHSNPHKIQGR
jgi:hypothetical protein